MPDIIYLEPDEEITKVIDRLKESRSDFVVFVIARGSNLAQSIVNLKILKRSAEELDKIIALVTNDQITQNIAAQINLSVFSKVTEAEKARPNVNMVRKPLASKPQEGADGIDGDADDSGQFRVHTYKRYGNEEAAEPVKEDMPLVEKQDEPDHIEVSDKDNNEGTEEDYYRNDDAEPKAEETEEDYYRHDDEKENGEAEETINREENTSHKFEVKEVKARKDNEEEENKMAPLATNRRMHRNIQGSRKPFLAIIGIVLLLVLVAGYVLVPTASVAITLRAEDYQSDFSLTADKNLAALDAANLSIPGTLLELEKETSQDFNSSGKKDAGTKATGKITVQNSYDTNSHKYQAGSRFTAAGKTFLANTAFTVPAASIAPSLVDGVASVNVTPGVIEVAVTAEKSGDQYNVASATYVLEGAPAKIVGKGGEMAGGVTKEIGVVLDKDLETAETSIKKDVLTQAQKELSDQAVANGSILMESTVSGEIITVSSSAKVDDEVDTFKYTAKIKVYGLTVKESDIKSSVVEAVASKIGDGKMVVGADRSTIAYTAESYDKNQGKLKLKASFSGKVGERYKVEEISQLIKNSTVAKAKDALTNKSGIENAEINLSPNFITRTPVIAKRISVKFDYADTSK